MEIVVGTQMADPGECETCSLANSVIRIACSAKEIGSALKYSQFPIVHLLMKELNLCANNPIFVPPW